VPLSDREQQILEEIEQSLYKEDPTFARGVAGRVGGEAKLGRWGAIGLLGGIALLVLFFVTRIVLLGLVSFLAMVAGIILIVTAIAAAANRAREAGTSPKHRFEDLVKGLEQRFKTRYRRR
jgi:Protein of unknown function (DUF3040)